jgi:hypothetical protein
MVEGERDVLRILVGNPEERLRLERSARRGVHGIKLHLAEIGWSGMDWTGLRIGTTGGLL